MPLVTTSQKTVVVKGSAHTGVAVLAFPDVCKTPTSPAPVPIPYPSLGSASQVNTVAKDASGNLVVKKSAGATGSTGSEAGTAHGLMSNKVVGKTTFMMSSMDVKAEGKSVARSFDLATQNQAGAAKSSLPAAAAPKTVVVNQARVAQLRSRLQAITLQLVALQGGNPNVWHKLVDEYVLVTTELYLELTPG